MGKWSDDEILRGIEAGGRLRDIALDALYKRDEAAIVKMIRSHSGTKMDAEEIFNDTILAFLDNVLKRKFRRDSSISTYLRSIAYFKWLNELKKRKKYEEREKLHADYEKLNIGAPETFLDPENLPEDTAWIKEECLEWLKGRMEQLSEVCRKLLHSRFFERHPIMELTVLHGYKDDQVTRSKLYKCLQRLRELLEDDPMDCIKELI